MEGKVGKVGTIGKLERKRVERKEREKGVGKRKVARVGRGKEIR